MNFKIMIMLQSVIVVTADVKSDCKSEESSAFQKYALPVAGGVAAFAAAPAVLAAAGFGAGGIAVGSLAAKAMSLAATTGYGAGVVGTLQKTLWLDVLTSPTHILEDSSENCQITACDDGVMWNWIVPIGVGVTAVAATPLVLPFVGFTSGGIAAASLAAKAMSLAATKGTGMAVVSTLQSVGAAGLTAKASATIVVAGTSTTKFVKSLYCWVTNS